MPLEPIDRIDSKGNICEHVVNPEADRVPGPYGNVMVTLCGLRVFESQRAIGNYKCRKCQVLQHLRNGGTYDTYRG